MRTALEEAFQSSSLRRRRSECEIPRTSSLRNNARRNQSRAFDSRFRQKPVQSCKPSVRDERVLRVVVDFFERDASYVCGYRRRASVGEGNVRLG